MSTQSSIGSNIFRKKIPASCSLFKETTAATTIPLLLRKSSVYKRLGTDKQSSLDVANHVPAVTLVTMNEGVGQKSVMELDFTIAHRVNYYRLGFQVADGYESLT
jgi:hypothetical protein